MSDTGAHHASSPSRPTSPSQAIDPTPEIPQQSGLSAAIRTVGIMAKANEAQNLLNRAVESDMEPNEFLLSLRKIGITANEAVNYVDEYEQQMEIKRGKARETTPRPNESPGGERPPEIEQNQVDKHIDDAAWAALHAKLEAADPFIEKSRRLKAAFTSEKSIDLLIDRAQLERLVDPISQSVWKKIILDRYVDFEHLYVTFEKGYDHNDETKDFNEEFAIVKKDLFAKKKSVTSESDWLHLFDAWKAAVLVFYRHRDDELSVYREYVVKIFRSSPSPSSAILFDREV
ncbi:hypothetical protein H0H87_007044 [Tephrocybe sp. NHM501043]|nr:hypothetical protein H0H87_008788 [Tephrocybe sp. NHM501043]KAG6855187.1 hypothetical protein H0H87_007044 [Tephrocybe sp. NHM501043]